MLATAVLLVYANVGTEEMMCTVWLSLRLRLAVVIWKPMAMV
jgi:hypothetical protein